MEEGERVRVKTAATSSPVLARPERGARGGRKDEEGRRTSLACAPSAGGGRLAGATSQPAS